MKIEEFQKLKDFSFLKTKNTSDSEFRSWQNSLPHLQKALIDLDEYEIYLEYSLPNSPERVDAVIVGESIVFIELKQWSREKCRNLDSQLINVLGEDKINPSLQVENYKKHFQLFTDLQKKIYTVVFMHNFEGKIKEYNSKVFYKGEYKKFNSFLKQVLKQPNSSFKFEIKPQKKLIEVIKQIQKGESNFILSTTQREIAYQILKSDSKSIMIKGMPGSGKSVLALNLHFFCLQKNMLSSYITKNSTPRIVYESILNENQYNLGFKSPRYINDCDIAIVDEAHRLQKDQLENILQKSKKVLFFYDDKQVVSCEDIGDEIYNYIDQIFELNEQFRCNGSVNYLNWIDHILYNKKFNGVIDYDIVICEDIDEFVQNCKEKNARITAGYCWDWVSKNNKKLFDIEIGKYKWQWNLHEQNDWKKQFKWSIDTQQQNNVGCIHTVQGMEMEYVGVIIGKDLYFKENMIKTDSKARASDDRTIKGCTDDEKKDQIIRNTYRVLLSRGLKGCYVYCMDKNLTHYLKKIVEITKK
ncbi:DNA/RNA helicase domain-containing protein [Nitrosophilus kaiyonis]|uniref:DNA/RNA helicase domain-containing protein n=1 Tax=Nitrosophilus kaiyonis TaxID=2930200 RepID=UPI00249327E2|nr:DNA/RNA helicase domain-containing protein [Nitrosophilus kaiyonis]